MENSAEEIARKKIVVIGAGFLVLVLLVLMIWMILGVRWRSSRVATMNREEVMSGSDGMTQVEVENIETWVSSIIEMYYQDKVPNGKKATMAIRRKVGKTLVDVEELHVTFEMGAVISCAEFEDSKYTDGLCVTSEGRTTIGMVFGNGLPVQSSVEESEEGYKESVKRDGKNDKKRWFLNTRTDENNRPKLVIYTDTCDEDEKYVESVEKYVRWLDKKWGMEAFEYEISCPSPDESRIDSGDKK